MSMFSRIRFMMVIFFLTLQSLQASNIEARLKFPEYSLYHGYPTQTHTIRTQDGYNLRFFRLQAKNTDIQNKEKVVYLQHGLQDTSDTWIVNEEHLAPGFALANQGYDVWVGNTRGNLYSSPVLNPRVKNFWDFSIDEMVKYDIPAAFEYIHEITHKKIHYVGHSQGTMIMFAALSEHNQVVRSLLASYSALGPVAYIQKMESKLLKTACNPKFLQILRSAGIEQLMYTTQNVHFILSELCILDPTLCKITLSEISEKNNTVNNVDRMKVVMGHFPGGSSVKNMEHFAQNYKSGKFCKFDYGAKKNQQKYGSPEPPKYDLSRIDFPVHLFVGEYDRLADVADATRLYNELTNSPNKSMRLLKFGHATFIWGKELTYMGDLINIIEKS